MVRVAAGGELFQRGGQFVLGLREQAQWPRRKSGTGIVAVFAEVHEAIAQSVGKRLHEGCPLHLQLRAAVGAVLLHLMVARMLHLVVQILVEAIQALAQRGFQPLRAQRTDDVEQALRA